MAGERHGAIRLGFAWAAEALPALHWTLFVHDGLHAIVWGSAVSPPLPLGPSRPCLRPASALRRVAMGSLHLQI